MSYDLVPLRKTLPQFVLLTKRSLISQRKAKKIKKAVYQKKSRVAKKKAGKKSRVSSISLNKLKEGSTRYHTSIIFELTSFPLLSQRIVVDQCS